RYKLDDCRPYLFRTRDYGKNWEAITAGIPDQDFTRAIRVDPTRPGLLYAGTETGMYVSFDDGGQWARLGGSLPVAPIYDMVRKDDDLVVATHGRSFWILEDVALLHQLCAGTRITDQPQLFAPAATEGYRVFAFESAAPGISYSHAGPLVHGRRQKQRPDGSTETTFLDAGKNPPAGVAVRYWLPARPEGDVTLTFLDAEGNEIRTFTSKKEKPGRKPDDEGAEEQGPALELGGEVHEGGMVAGEVAEEEKPDEKQPVVAKEAGMNRFIWDMRGAEARKVKDDTSMAFFLNGPTVLPGRYQVRLQVGEESWTQPIEILPDPRGHETPEGDRARYDLLV